MLMYEKKRSIDRANARGKADDGFQRNTVGI